MVFGVPEKVQTLKFRSRKQKGFYGGVDLKLFLVFPKKNKNILNDLFGQCLIVKVDIYEDAQVVIIPIKKIFEGVNISFNHLLYNEEFVASYFFGQCYSEFGLKLQFF